jgi:hypothetical protein
MEEKKLQELVASAFASGDREAVAQLIVEYVNPTHITGEMMGLILDTRSLSPGDALVKKVRKGINVRTLVPGTVHLGSEITVSERINYVLDGADVKVSYNEWDIENGLLQKSKAKCLRNYVTTTTTKCLLHSHPFGK